MRSADTRARPSGPLPWLRTRIPRKIRADLTGQDPGGSAGCCPRGAESRVVIGCVSSVNDSLRDPRWSPPLEEPRMNQRARLIYAFPKSRGR